MVVDRQLKRLLNQIMQEDDYDEEEDQGDDLDTPGSYAEPNRR